MGRAVTAGKVLKTYAWILQNRKLRRQWEHATDVAAKVVVLPTKNRRGGSDTEIKFMNPPFKSFLLKSTLLDTVGAVVCS